MKALDSLTYLVKGVQFNCLQIKRFCIVSGRVLKASRAVRVQGARSAETGVYVVYMRISSTAQPRPEPLSKGQQSSRVAAFKTRS